MASVMFWLGALYPPVDAAIAQQQTASPCTPLGETCELQDQPVGLLQHYLDVDASEKSAQDVVEATHNEGRQKAMLDKMRAVVTNWQKGHQRSATLDHARIIIEDLQKSGSTALGDLRNFLEELRSEPAGHAALSDLKQIVGSVEVDLQRDTMLALEQRAGIQDGVHDATRIPLGPMFDWLLKNKAVFTTTTTTTPWWHWFTAAPTTSTTDITTSTTTATADPIVTTGKVPTYFRLSSGCGNPTHLGGRRNLDLEACKAACNARSDCGGFDSNGGFLAVNESLLSCFLKGNCDGSPGWGTGFKKVFDASEIPDPVNTTATYVRLSDRCGNVTHLGGRLALDTNACKAACSVTSNCGGFNSFAGKWCFLKRNCDGSPGTGAGYKKVADASAVPEPIDTTSAAVPTYVQLSANCSNATHLGGRQSLDVDACRAACSARSDCGGFDLTGSAGCYLKGRCDGSPGTGIGYKKVAETVSASSVS